MAICNPSADDSGSDDLWALVIDDQQLTIMWRKRMDVPWSRKFTFGRFQALLMIDCADEIARFVAAPNPAGVSIGAVFKVIEAGVTSIQTFPDFTLDTGRRIDRPYIKLERHKTHHWHPWILIERFRARAFLHFQPEIRNWAAARN